MGKFSGVVPIFTLMPIDIVDTKTQSLNISKCTSTLKCFTLMFKQEGLKIFWKSVPPRLGRLIFGGGVFVTIFEKILVIFN